MARFVSRLQAKSFQLAVASVLVGGLVVAGVGGASASSGHSAKTVVLSAQSTSSFGTILVSGDTLYALTPSHTACTAACLQFWPALTLPKGAKSATAGKGVSAAKIGAVNRAGGLPQVTYAGKALYYFSGDTKPGQVKGNVTDTWGKWYPVVLSTKGTGSGGATTTTTSPGGGGVGF